MNPDQPIPTGNLQPKGRLFRPLWLIVGAVVIFLGVVVFFAFKGQGSSGPATGEVVVSTSDKNNSITLTSLSDQTTKSDTGSLDVQVKPGTYSVTVTNNQLSASQLVTVTAKKITRVTVNPGRLGTAEPVSDRPTTNLVADGSGLRFTALDTGNLYAVGAANNEQLLDSSHGFTRVSWADPSFGVGQSRTGQLFVINNSTVSPLNTPVAPTNPKTSFGLAPNHTLYVSDGSQVFAGTPGSAFKKIFQTTGNIVVLAASNAAVVTSEGKANAPGNGLVRTITPGGTVNQLTFEAYQAAWSQSGKYLVITGDETTIVTDASLKQVGNIPATNVTSPAWLDDNTVFYGIGSGLWRYDQHTGHSDLLSNMPQGAFANNITPSRDGSFIYVLLQTTTHSGDDAFHLDRLGLHGQPVSNTAIALSGLLPNPISPCVVGYLNFSRADVMVHGPAAAATSCVQAAKNFIAPYASIIGGDLQYQFSLN